MVKSVFRLGRHTSSSRRERLVRGGFWIQPVDPQSTVRHAGRRATRRRHRCQASLWRANAAHREGHRHHWYSGDRCRCGVVERDCGTSSSSRLPHRVSVRARPLASNLNFVAGDIVPNLVIAPVSASGEVCVFASVDTDIVADVTGWFAAGSEFSAMVPTRLFDTRPGEPAGKVDVAKQRYGGSNILRVRVLGVSTIPTSGVRAVSLNVTAVDPVGRWIHHGLFVRCAAAGVSPELRHR